MSAAAKPLPDTDWHLERLYDFLGELGASVLVATHSRYVVDLNRPPDNANLYPGQDTTGVVPLDTFHREPLYLPGFPPSDEEVTQRIETYWRPYHQRLQQTLAETEGEARLRASLGCALDLFRGAALLQRQAHRF